MPTTVNDEFIEELSKLKKNEQLNLEDLKIENSSITSKCIGFLNVLDLNSLSIAGCKNIDTLKGLNLPNLKIMNIGDCNFDDDAIFDLLKHSPLTKLNALSLNCILTGRTLQNICALNLYMQELSLIVTETTLKEIERLPITSLLITKMIKVRCDKFELLLRKTEKYKKNNKNSKKIGSCTTFFLVILFIFYILLTLRFVIVGFKNPFY